MKALNIFNRLIGILVAVLLVVGGVLALLSASDVADAQAVGTPWLEEGLRRLAQPDLRTIAIVASGVAILAGLLLLFMELLPPRREAATMALKQDALGSVTVTRQGVRELVNREADQVDGVNEVDSQVTENRNGLRVFCRLSVSPTANVPELAEEVRQRVKTAVEHRLGKPVAEVAVQTQLAPMTRGRRVR